MRGEGSVVLRIAAVSLSLLMAVTFLSCGGGGDGGSSPGFTTAMLDGKVFYREDFASRERAVIHFEPGGVLVDRGADNTGVYDDSGTWAVDNTGVLTVNEGSGDIVISLVRDTSTYMDITVDDAIDPPEPDRLYKTVAFGDSDVVGTHTWEFNDLTGSASYTWTVTFEPGGSGRVQGGDAFGWGIGADGTMWMRFSPDDEDTYYKLPTSTTSVLKMAGESVMYGAIDGVLSITLR